MKFPCKACGECCRHVDGHVSLDRGDGVCRHFDEQTLLCSVYESRPLACNVDKVYTTYFKQSLGPKAYYMTQAVACTMLHPDNSDMPQLTESALAEAGFDGGMNDFDVVEVSNHVMGKLTDMDFRFLPDTSATGNGKA